MVYRRNPIGRRSLGRRPDIVLVTRSIWEGMTQLLYPPFAYFGGSLDG